MTVEASFLIAGACVTNAAFVLAAVALYDLSVKVIKNEQMAYISCLLFCYNPASIFMSAVYTGSLYACLSFYGMLYLERTSYYSSSTGFRYCAETLMSMLLFAGACATRSNGLLLSMYPAYFVFKDVIWPALLKSFCKVHHGHTDHGISNQSSLKKALFVMKNAVTSLCSVAPYFLVQSYGYELYCVGRKEELRPQWCKDSNIYKHVQERYWGSGVIFGYWTINQIPNFVLAAPILYVSYFAFFHYIQKTIHQKSYSHKHNRVLNYITSSLGLNYIVDYTSNLDLAMVGYLSHRSAPYVWHLFGLTSLIVVMAHVQISTRVLCASCPAVYWFVAYTFVRKKANTQKFLNCYLIFTWLYFTLGCVLFSTFYPWT